MPSAYDIRSSAWKKIKEGGLLPALAGFAILFLLGTLADAVLSRVGVKLGLIAEIPLDEFMRFLGFYVDDEMARGLAKYTMPYPTYGYMAFIIVVQAMWNGILSFGGAVLSISVMRGGPTAFQAMSGFRWPFRTAVLGALRTLLIALWSLLLIIPGFYAAYSYRMAFYLLADHPDWSPWKALQKSKRLMYGHRWRLACLDASFIGWFLLVGITRGLAGIFVAPYYAIANAAFYEDLLDRNANGEA